jgi:cytochrome b
VHAVSEIKGASRLVWVWDLPTSLFHWLLVGAVLTALATEFIAPAWWLSWHIAAGYTIAALLLFRLVWAVFGSE